MKTAFVSEIYASIQGEGPYTGERQVFLRLAGCPLRCDYCDTPESLNANGHPQLSVDEVAGRVIRECERHAIRTVSVTGGEPLAQVDFLTNFLPLLKSKGFNIYLETAGVHPGAFSQIVHWCDVVAMDVKLPSATRKSFWEDHLKFLAVGEQKIFVKMVLEKHTPLDDVDKSLAILSGSDRPPPLVIQPVTPVLPGVESPTPAQVALVYERARRLLPRVTVMPQQHKIWQIR